MAAVSEYFGSLVFDDRVMKANLSAEVYQSLKRTIDEGAKLNIGVANAKMLCRHFRYDLSALRSATLEELSQIDGIGEVIAFSIRAFFDSEKNQEQLEHLLQELTIVVEVVEEGVQTLSGMSFVITGSLVHFENRNLLKEEIEKKGGKVTGSVTGKTTCLINNDTTSQSSKNKKAKELGVRIVSEEEFLEEYLNDQ